jgi:hypothetical protein
MLVQHMQDHAEIHTFTRPDALGSVGSRGKWRPDCNGGGGLLDLSCEM